MRIAKVPIDMSSEQKEILGVVSKRQLVYMAVGGLLLYSYFPKIFSLFAVFHWLVGFIFALVSAVPVVVIVLILGFTKVNKYNMYRDYYLYTRFLRKTQYGSWRKGN